MVVHVRERAIASLQFASVYFALRTSGGLPLSLVNLSSKAETLIDLY